MSNYKSFSLKQITTGIYDCPHSTPKWTESGILVIRNFNIKGGRLKLDDLSFTDEINYKQRIKRAVPSSGDLILTREAPMGEVCMIPENLKCCLGQRVVLIKPDPNKVYPKYLLYKFQAPEILNQIMMSEGSGSVVSNLRIPHIENLKFKLPDYTIQKKAADILSSLEDKIELNRRINQTLVQIAATLYKKYFVDDIDPNNLPANWNLNRVSEQFDISIGRTPPRAETQWFTNIPNDVKWISIKDMGNSGVYISNTSEYLTAEAVKKFNIPLIAKETVILSFKLTVGRVSITKHDMLSNEAIAHFNPKRTCFLTPYYTYMVLKNFDYGSLGNTSSIATAVNSQTVKDMKIIVPPYEVISDYSKTVKPLFELIKKNSEQIENLKDIRDSILPKLLSGEIDLSTTNQNAPQHAEVLS